MSGAAKVRRNGLVLAAGLALIGAVVVLLCFSYVRNMSGTVRADTERYLAEIGSHVAAMVDSRVADRLEDLQITADAYAEFDDPVQGMAYLKRVSDAYGFLSITAVSADGTARTTDGRSGYAGQDPALERAMAGEGCMTTTDSGGAQVRHLIYLVPVRREGRPAGALAATCSHGTIRAFLQEEIFSGRGYSGIVDARGDFIIHSDSSAARTDAENFFTLVEAAGGAAGLEEMRENMAAGRGGLVYYTLEDGVEKAVCYTPLEYSGWTLLCVVPTSVTEERTQPLVERTLLLTAVIVGLFLFLFLLIFTLYRHSQRQLERLAYVDGVTGGLSRAKFELEAGRLLAASPPGTYALVSVDIQKFKLINDAFGSADGNRALKHVHDTMVLCLRRQELAARLSADTFNLLLFNTSREEIAARLERIAERVNAYNDGLEKKYYMPLSAGVYLVNDPALDFITIQDRANVARKKNRRLGAARLSACTFYSDVERRRLLREKEIDNRMAAALAGGEFIVYLQPKVSLESGRVTGAEALVRWQDPEKGLIPPDEFIPVLEQNGFITRLDLYVFEQVCALLRRWIGEGRAPIPVSVNLSRVHLDNPGFLADYQAVLEKYAVPPALIEMELTETLVLEDVERVVQVIGQIHALGCRCALDDFGSGYSSLNALREIPADVLKLDKAFFDESAADRRSERVVESVIELARKLDMETVSEGVEKPEQVEFLRRARCDMVQGYVFSRPVPVEQFEALAFHGPISCVL